MKRYLLDTNVVSATSPLRNSGSDERLRRWLVERSQQLYLPAVAVGEIRAGVESCLRRGQTAKARHLSDWLERLVEFFARRILAVDARVADLSGILYGRALADGHAPGWIDVQIAATAQANELVLLTRNARHFAPMGVDFCDPFGQDPAFLD